MKKLMIKHQILKLVFESMFILFLFNNNAFSQQPNIYDCGTLSSPSYSSLSTFVGGNLKPERSDLSLGMPADSTAYFPTLIVLVQFANEPEQSTYWPIGGPPTFISEMLSYDKVSRTDWWNSYNPNTQTVSSWWHEVSRGKLHVLGQAISVVLDRDTGWYIHNGGEDRVNFDVYEKLRQNTTIDWTFYDKWRKINGQFKYEADQKVDMIYMVHRRTFSGGPLIYAAGYVPLGYANGQIEYEVDPVNHIKINGSYTDEGSGIKINGKFGVADKNHVVAVSGHEVGHYLFGSGHTVYSKMAYGPGSESFYCPWEEIKLGYMIPTLVDFNNFNYEYVLGDYSSRGQINGNIIQVPISGDGQEFFLIANRRKESQHDRIANGDTLSYGNANLSSTIEYGKGTYIYHIFDGYSYPSGNVINNDLECADGLFNWQQTGLDAPDWNLGNPYLPVLEPLSVSYNNDNGANGMTGKDGYNVRSFESKWFSKGKKETGYLTGGLTRTYTNLNQNWTSRDLSGDRYDAWKPGYNEIFSPYSSPSTIDKNNVNTGIFIWNNSVNPSTNIANYKIFKAGVNYSEGQILQWTPPSRPMGIVVDYYLESEDYMRPIITWNHNKEPDMLRTDLKKRYKIWRATTLYMTIVPTSYILLDTIDIDSGAAPSYIDYSIIGLGSGWPGMGEQIQYPVRYTVQAIDKYEDPSVRSDFGMAIGLRNCAVCAVEDNIILNSDLPTEFALKQNYPNPFNPSTNIEYDLPLDNFVTIKIFDILGKEIMTLVNEFKQAGRYVISFNGNNLPSGIYYYKIKAGNFDQVRKMILIK